MRTSTVPDRISELLALGFNNTVPSGRRQLRIACSQCEVMVINGTLCHETGCPNATHPCSECDAPTTNRRGLCDDCQDPERWDGLS